MRKKVIWRRLGSFPLTNGIGVFTLVAWSVTGLAALLGAAFHVFVGEPPLRTAVYSVPPEWLEALKWITAYAFAQFTAKRWTNGRGMNGNGNGNVPKPQ